MKYNLHVNQVQAIELGIKNINQALIFDLLSICAVWAEEEIIDNKVYYFVARQKIADELKILDLKLDTVYRHLKSLADIGVIEYKKSGKKDCIRITKKGKKYHSNTMSEINPNFEENTMSEINPKKLGNKSEKHSDLFPTYNTTIHYPTTILSPLEKKGEKTAAQIIKFYKENISSLESKIKEIKSMNALALLGNELDLIYTGLENYAKDLPTDKFKIKNLFNFIQDKSYKDYQVATKINKQSNNLHISDKEYKQEEF